MTKRTKKKADFAVFELPRRWVIPFLASWRVLERTLNPAFEFIIRCTSCGAMGASHIRTVASRKNPKAILGMQCGKCGQTAKFEGTIDPGSKDFPKRLRDKHGSVLETPDGYKPSDGALKPGDVTDLVLGK